MKHTLLPQAALSRRMFISRTAWSALTLVSLKSTPTLAQSQSTAAPMTVQQIMDLILKEAQLSPIKNTVDTLKSGSGDQTVTGIVTTMFPTITVIEEAARLKANFIIAHEPAFYNHTDNPAWVENNSVVKQKQEILARYGIRVWRFHDYIHQMMPDGISYGVAKKANWLPYYKLGNVMLTIPSLPLDKLVRHLKTSLEIDHLRVIGDPAQPCARIALLPGAWGGARQVGPAEREKPDVLIVGEVSEWETAEYIRDARLLGRPSALIVLGHAVSEEPGMEYLADWLRPRLPAINTTHVPSGSPFRWM